MARANGPIPAGLAREARASARKYLDRCGVAGAVRQLGIRFCMGRSEEQYSATAYDAATAVTGFGVAETEAEARAEAVANYLYHDYLGGQD